MATMVQLGQYIPPKKLNSGGFSDRGDSTLERIAKVNKIIREIQTEIRTELGFREIIVTSGETVEEQSGNSGPWLEDETRFRSSGRLDSPSLDFADTNQSMMNTNDFIALSRKGFQFGAKRHTSDTGSEHSSCGDCCKGTVYVSPRYDEKKRLLVIVPYREAGVWSRSMCMQEGKNRAAGSMLSYLKKALSENYGVIIMNPAAQPCHPRNHVEHAWDQLVVPLDSDVFLLAFSRGCQLVQHLLSYDNGQGIVQDRVKALALVEPSHYVNDTDSYFGRRILARRAIAWLLSSEIDVGLKIPRGESRHGCICISVGAVPAEKRDASLGFTLELVQACVFGTFAARCGEAAGITVNDSKVSTCGICRRRLGVLNRRFQCTWCEVKYCSKCCEDKFVPAFGSWRICSLCQVLPCLIDPRRKKRNHPNSRGSLTESSRKLFEERCSVFVKPQKDEPASLKDFEVIKLIGRGACGRVKLVRKKHGKDEGKFFAMKAIKKKLVIQRGLVDATMAERRILDRINHPYIAGLCYAFQNDAKLYLLSKYYPGGNLLDQMRLARRFSEDRTRLYAAEVALALQHLHDNNIIYRDLKLENVLVDSEGHVALTDFGMSKENMGPRGRTTTFVGTYQMMAPEVFSGMSYSRAVDWWALGVMVYEMIDGRTPFNAKTNKLIKERIMKVDLKFSSRFTVHAKDFVSRLLTKNEDLRLGCGRHSFEILKAHPWFNGIDWNAVAQRKLKFEGQEQLMKSHAKEYRTSDIFDTFMNTLEMPVDTPVSVKSSSGDLFSGFAYSCEDGEEDMDIAKPNPPSVYPQKDRKRIKSPLVDDSLMITVPEGEQVAKVPGDDWLLSAKKKNSIEDVQKQLQDVKEAISKQNERNRLDTTKVIKSPAQKVAEVATQMETPHTIDHEETQSLGSSYTSSKSNLSEDGDSEDELDRLLDSAVSCFDISLLRPNQAIDFSSALSSLSSRGDHLSTNEHQEEDSSTENQAGLELLDEITLQKIKLNSSSNGVIEEEPKSNKEKLDLTAR